jgi:hypothetical protein
LAIALCHRNTQLVMDDEYEALWFRLLDAIYERAQKYAVEHPLTPTKTTMQKSQTLGLGLAGTRSISRLYLLSNSFF